MAKYVVEIADNDVSSLNWIKVNRIFIKDLDHSGVEILSIERVDG